MEVASFPAFALLKWKEVGGSRFHLIFNLSLTTEAAAFFGLTGGEKEERGDSWVSALHSSATALLAARSFSYVNRDAHRACSTREYIPATPVSRDATSKGTWFRSCQQKCLLIAYNVSHRVASTLRSTHCMTSNTLLGHARVASLTLLSQAV